MVYIRAHDRKAVKGIDEGAYLLRFALGWDWDSRYRRFLHDEHFYEAGRELVFTEVEPTEEVRGRYVELQITLHQVSNGNLPRKGISSAEFDEGNRAKPNWSVTPEDYLKRGSDPKSKHPDIFDRIHAERSGRPQ